MAWGALNPIGGMTLCPIGICSSVSCQQLDMKEQPVNPRIRPVCLPNQHPLASECSYAASDISSSEALRCRAPVQGVPVLCAHPWHSRSVLTRGRAGALNLPCPSIHAQGL